MPGGVRRSDNAVWRIEAATPEQRGQCTVTSLRPPSHQTTLLEGGAPSPARGEASETVNGPRLPLGAVVVLVRAIRQNYDNHRAAYGRSKLKADSSAVMGHMA